MLYGIKEDGGFVVVAADTLAELNSFAEGLIASQKGEAVDDLSLFQDTRLRGARSAYRVPDDSGFVIKEIATTKIRDLVSAMQQDVEEDMFTSPDLKKKSIREIYGIVDHDPWDTRTPEMKERDADIAKKRKERDGAGMSGESFSPSSGGEVGISEIRGVKDEKGNIDVSEVIAHKGLFEEGEEEELGENPMRIKTETFKTLYRVDIHGITLEQFDVLVQSVNASSMIIDRGLFEEDGSTGVWTASGLLRLAEKINSTVNRADGDLVTEVYAVNRENERLVPKGTVVIDAKAEREIGPRPWNDRAAEWFAWSDEERENEIKENVKSDEFFYAGGDTEQYGALVKFVPVSYFRAHDEMFDGPLPIKHLIPHDLNEQEPGTYTTKLRDFMNVRNALGTAGMKESMLFRNWLNNQV